MYGKLITEHSTTGDDEPVILCRAEDKLVPAVLDDSAEMCAAAGSSRTRHLDILAESRANCVAWQAENRRRDSEWPFGRLVRVLGRDLVLQSAGVNDHAA